MREPCHHFHLVGLSLFVIIWSIRLFAVSNQSQFGVIVGLCSTCIQSFGLTLQRKSHMLEDEKANHIPKRAPYRRRRWQIGMALFLLSNIVGATIQITTLPLPLLSTLQASGLVFNALLATLILHEPFTRQTALGTILIAAGAVLISLFSALPEPSHTLDQLLELLVVPGFVIWMALTLLLVAIVLVATFFLGYLVHNNESPRTILGRGMAYGMVSGILSAHALLLAKSAVELLVRTIADHHNQFDRYQSWLILVAFLVLSLTQLYYLHLGLKLVSTSILYPFVFCMYNIVAIMDGLIYFRQMNRLSLLHGSLIALGTAVLLSGVLSLGWRLTEEEEPESPEVASPIILGPHRRNRSSTIDMPHSALTPGMGFVPNTAHDSSKALPFFGGIYRGKRLLHDGDEEDDPAGETAPLIRRHTIRDAAGLDHDIGRGGPLFREYRDVWSELREDDDDQDAASPNDGLKGRRRVDQRPQSAPAKPHDHDSHEQPLDVVTVRQGWVSTFRRNWFGRRPRRSVHAEYQDDVTES